MNICIRWLALVLALVAAIQIAGSQTHDTSYWRQVFNESPRTHAAAASRYGVGEASHFLGDIYWRSGERSRALFFYQRAVRQGDAGAAYALSRHVPAQSRQWLRAAADLGDPGASLSVASALFDQAPHEAFNLVAGLAPGKEQRELLASLLIRYPYFDSTTVWQQVAPDTAVWQRRRRGAAILQAPKALDCKVPVTVYVASVEGNEALYDWLAQLSSHALSALDFCFTLAIDPSLQCETSEGRSSCESHLPAGNGHQWFVTDQGIANARGSQLYLPSSADFDVVVHELAHWFGMADEYPMSADLASLFCSGRYNFEAQNVVVTQSQRLSEAEYVELRQRIPWRERIEQPIARQGEDGRYELGSADRTKAGLFPARTCEHAAGYFAWKAVARTTFMEQHEVGKIPPLYIELMKNTLPVE
jgi:hypothetical protein